MKLPVALMICVALCVGGCTGAGKSSGTLLSPRPVEPENFPRPDDFDETPAFGTKGKLPVPEPITPPTSEELEAAITHGVNFLLETQNRNGSWGTFHTKDFNVWAPLPGSNYAFRAATTGLCMTGLLDIGDEREEVQNAIDRAEKYLFENLQKVRRISPDVMYNVWSHAYVIKALVRLRERYPEGDAKRVKIDELIDSQIELLERFEGIRGGWGYYPAVSKKPITDSTSFITASAMIALSEARSAGFKVPQRIVDRGVEALHRAQKPDFSYMYTDGWWRAPTARLSMPGGSLARSQSCNAALRMWGDEEITDDVLVTWVNRICARNLWLNLGRKTIYPHESFDAVAGYFYFYGHNYAAQCISLLPPEKRPPLQEHLAAVLLSVQDGDGSWWDYPLYGFHKQYGTGYTLSALAKCRKAQ